MANISNPASTAANFNYANAYNFYLVKDENGSISQDTNHISATITGSSEKKSFYSKMQSGLPPVHSYDTKNSKDAPVAHSVHEQTAPFFKNMSSNWLSGLESNENLIPFPKEEDRTQLVLLPSVEETRHIGCKRKKEDEPGEEKDTISQADNFCSPKKEARTEPVAPDSVIKEWPVTRDDTGKIHIDMSPNSKEELRNKSAIYRFKCESNVDDPTKGQDVPKVTRVYKENRRCIGSTVNITQRLSQYRHIVNNTKSRRHIEQALRKYPTRFTLGIMKIVPQGTPEQDLLELEASLQDQYKSREREYGFNKTDPRSEPLRRGKRAKKTDSDMTSTNSTSMEKVAQHKYATRAQAKCSTQPIAQIKQERSNEFLDTPPPLERVPDSV